MDRRDFFVAGSLAAASQLAFAGGAPIPDANGELFRHVDFVSDGLGLRPREYVALLQQAANARTWEADQYSIGGAIGDLERYFAKRLGKEAAIFVPTGTLANHLAIRKLAGADRRVLVQAESHLYNDSGDAASVLSGLNLIPLGLGQSAITVEHIAPWLKRTAGGRVAMAIGAISIESPVRRRDHQMVAFDELRRISQLAREHGIRLHLDGARLFSMPLHSGKTLQQYTALFDTVYVSLWKHFNGTAGAILAGDQDFIEGLYHQRRLFGGSLPQAWPQVALVEQYAETFLDDYASAWQANRDLLQRLEASGKFKASLPPDGTSRYHLELIGADPAALVQGLASQDIILPAAITGSSRFVMQVNPTLLRRSVTALAEKFLAAART